jgi:hypothetical protein
MSYNNLFFNQSLNMVFNASSKVMLENTRDNLIDFLLIAGGGGGAKSSSYGMGGGGAGGYIYYTGQTIVSGTYSIVVGDVVAAETQGNNSTFSGYTALGGGRGGWTNVNGSEGGCGGGAGAGVSYTTYGGIGDQGFKGGDSIVSQVYAGGGGGIGSAGANAVPGGGAGGSGKSFSIFTGNTFGVGGAAGYGSTHGIPGGINTGNGGGANETGGSGICIVRYTTTDFPNSSGGSASVVGNFTIRTFTANGNLVLA